MMVNHTKTLSDTQIRIPIDNNLEILLNIHKTKYNISMDNLFKVALRKNVKRDFIFVSKIIGKHIPIHPNALKLSGAILARLWLEEREGVVSPDTDILIQALNYLQELSSLSSLDKPLPPSNLAVIESALSIADEKLKLNNKTLFIGFAETATGIAQAIFNNFSNATYIHTTRENITSIPSSFLFKEEHSHATDHVIFPKNSNLFNEFDDIVLIDDELTTGKTSLNLIKNLPKKSFGIISILDWRTEEHINMFEELKDLDVRVCSLIKGTVNCIKKGEISQVDPTIEVPKSHSILHKDIIFKNSELIEGFHPYTGRFSIDYDDQMSLMEEIKEASTLLRKERGDGRCLCLGSGEFIYIPCMISAELGEKVYFHSTTRSPIFPRDFTNYAIENKVSFNSIDDDHILNYLYNIPKDFYSQVFFFTEKPIDERKKEEFKRIFSYFNIKEIVFVSWQSI
ncbi:phosphoribosyltransferase family protein [uncultured Clostridium sp.]|uniref:phosphoribosyltransferase family protein n=1 Tax=uncultured Clostridium sp. TaxID=59620 RepID=UPI0028E25579|nr:phosphoribosyltransferase family protein [uncultured Clostridium sp.]